MAPLFRNRLANDWVPAASIGVLTLTPYDYWRAHPRQSTTAPLDNLDRRELGSIEMLTVTEYEGLSPLRRLGYRLYRNPAILFLLGPAYMFILQHRLPVGMMKQGWKPWLSAMATNAAIFAIAAGLTMWATGRRGYSSPCTPRSCSWPPWRRRLAVLYPASVRSDDLGARRRVRGTLQEAALHR